MSVTPARIVIDDEDLLARIKDAEEELRIARVVNKAALAEVESLAAQLREAERNTKHTRAEVTRVRARLTELTQERGRRKFDGSGELQPPEILTVFTGLCVCGHVDNVHFDEIRFCGQCPCERFRHQP